MTWKRQVTAASPMPPSAHRTPMPCRTEPRRNAAAPRRMGVSRTTLAPGGGNKEASRTRLPQENRCAPNTASMKTPALMSSVKAMSNCDLAAEVGGDMPSSHRCMTQSAMPPMIVPPTTMATAMRRMRGSARRTSLDAVLPDVEVIGLIAPPSQRRARPVDPQLHGWTHPLAAGVRGQPLRHGIAMQQQAVQHQGEVDVGDAPFPAKVLGIVR